MEIQATPIKTKHGEWGFKFIIDMPKPMRKNSAEFKDWIESLQGQTVTVKTRTGKTWQDIIQWIDSVKPARGKATIVAVGAH